MRAHSHPRTMNVTVIAISLSLKECLVVLRASGASDFQGSAAIELRPPSGRTRRSESGAGAPRRLCETRRAVPARAERAPHTRARHSYGHRPGPA
jgi:hypothetical protein